MICYRGKIRGRGMGGEIQNVQEKETNLRRESRRDRERGIGCNAGGGRFRGEGNRVNGTRNW